MMADDDTYEPSPFEVKQIDQSKFSRNYNLRSNAPKEIAPMKMIRVNRIKKSIGNSSNQSTTKTIKCRQSDESKESQLEIPNKEISKVLKISLMTPEEEKANPVLFNPFHVCIFL
jgi:hypothetical protein